MKKILFIVTEYNSANGICVKSVIDSFDRSQAELYCITNKEKEYTNSFSENCKYFFVKPRLTYRLQKINEHTENKILKKLSGLTFNIVKKISLIKAYPTWPLISKLYSRRIYKLADKVCGKYGVDTIIPIYSQIDPLIAANRINKKHRSIKYIPYMLDSLSGGYGPNVFSAEQTVKRGLKWEDRLFPDAEKIIMMESCKAHYDKYSRKNSYYDRIVFLDLPLMRSREKRENESPLLPKGKINLLYVGTIPKHVRDPQYLLDVFGAVSGDDLALTIIGSSTCMEVLQKAREKDPRITIFPFVSHDEAMKAMQTADFLVNLGNRNTMMTPCKIFEYMSVGKPIISTAPIKNEPSLKYLEKYPDVCVLFEDQPVSLSADNLKKFVYGCKGKNTGYEVLKDLFPLNTPEAFVDTVI